jgi:undecaprenyl diphosphate synthase
VTHRDDDSAWGSAEAGAEPPVVPRHVAIIMDGNGRWAKRRGLPRVEGHRRGVETVRQAVRAAIEIGIGYLTIFSFSSENWSRPQSEVAELMGLLKRFIRRDLADLHKSGVRIRIIGERNGLEPEIGVLLDEAEQLTAANRVLTLTIAFNYGARDEIARAARKLAEKVEQGELKACEITPQRLAAELDTGELPDPDLLIRTSGELRLSNFLLWQSAYTELVFLDAYWPDFNKELLLAAIEDFRGRDRRFGGLTRRSRA